MQVYSRATIVTTIVLLSQVGLAEAQGLDRAERIQRINRIPRIGTRDASSGQEVEEIVIDRLGTVSQVKSSEAASQSKSTTQELDQLSARLNRLSQQISQITDALSERSEQDQSRDSTLAGVQGRVQALSSKVELAYEAIEANTVQRISETVAPESSETVPAVSMPLASIGNNESEVARVVGFEAQTETFEGGAQSQARDRANEKSSSAGKNIATLELSDGTSVDELHPLLQRLERLKQKLENLQIE